MSTFDQLFLTGFLIFWVVWAWSIFYFYGRGDKFFKILANKHPLYYQKIGRPKYFSANPIRNFRAGRYLSNLVFKGAPKDLPDEVKSRVLELRGFHLKQHIAFAVFFVLFIFCIILRELE